MPDDATIRAGIARYFKAYAKSDTVACAAQYAPDALILSPWGSPARGRTAIAQTHAAWFELGETDKSYRVKDLRIDGGLAVLLLSYSATLPSGGPVHGASLNVLTRQQDGAWLITHSSLAELGHADSGLDPA